MMKFDREKFINESGGSLDAAFNCIDNLLSVLENYIGADEVAEGFGAGCYGKDALDAVKSEISELGVGEYIDY